ncbi:MAG TPA: DUF2344 domain-containing protein [Candidatus Pullichristensenella excrementigallinarum]|uniref:DUF2344 domain-containing protein n=1 Tax=Candidatus Pullichristensenella excrementigallinarum TaxID=2840907 RepID=A0A9D1I9Q9_9FIRM|nr:DUF2344 domain-containing protein [Candidatus Pullichristensenella excrementigallinarum]
MRAWIRFGKNDRLRFVSHLDLQRFFQRALNRTGLPIAYSQGFNPHPVMSFGSALAVGWTSAYEILDFKLAVPMGRARTEEAMRSALPEDLPVLGVRMVDDRFPAPMARIEAAEYLLRAEDAPQLARAVEEFMARERVLAIRKTKSGEKEVDIRPMALALEPREEGLFARLMLTEQETLKPDLLLATLRKNAGLDSVPSHIHRLSLLGRGASGEWMPMMEWKP